jgi:hypothetical protein
MEIRVIAGSAMEIMEITIRDALTTELEKEARATDQVGMTEQK